VNSADRLALLAHELRSPVAALQAIDQTLRQLIDENDTDLLRRILLVAVEAGRDIERLLSDPELVSIRPIEIDIAEVLHTAVPSRPGAFPSVSLVAESAPVCVDPTRMRQVIANLVDNGLRHGASVTIDAHPDGREVVVTVADDGPGVDVGIDPFARNVSGSGSTGYGLWLARAIAEAHGGTLNLVSQPGAPARFRLALPLAGHAAG